MSEVPQIVMTQFIQKHQENIGKYIGETLIDIHGSLLANENQEMFLNYMFYANERSLDYFVQQDVSLDHFLLIVASTHLSYKQIRIYTRNHPAQLRLYHLVSIFSKSNSLHSFITFIKICIDHFKVAMPTIESGCENLLLYDYRGEIDGPIRMETDEVDVLFAKWAITYPSTTIVKCKSSLAPIIDKYFLVPGQYNTTKFLISIVLAELPKQLQSWILNIRYR